MWVFSPESEALSSTMSKLKALLHTGTEGFSHGADESPQFLCTVGNPLVWLLTFQTGISQPTLYLWFTKQSDFKQISDESGRFTYYLVLAMHW